MYELRDTSNRRSWLNVGKFYISGVLFVVPDDITICCALLDKPWTCKVKIVVGTTIFLCKNYNPNTSPLFARDLPHMHIPWRVEVKILWMLQRTRLILWYWQASFSCDQLWKTVLSEKGSRSEATVPLPPFACFSHYYGVADTRICVTHSAGPGSSFAQQNRRVDRPRATLGSSGPSG